MVGSSFLSIFDTKAPLESNIFQQSYFSLSVCMDNNSKRAGRKSHHTGYSLQTQIGRFHGNLEVSDDLFFVVSQQAVTLPVMFYMQQKTSLSSPAYKRRGADRGAVLNLRRVGNVLGKCECLLKLQNAKGTFTDCKDF